jgi:molybdenum cofactor synthesis domain-containing protein
MQKTVTACVLLLGNEILSGRTKDQNLPYISQKLNAHGVRVMEARVIADDEAAIIAAVNDVRAQFDYVFTTGGIGPTHDDITTACIAKAFGVPVVRHPESEAALRAYYAPDNVNEARLSMADIPKGATLIPNPISTAPGYAIDNVHVMAGVPKICQVMIDYAAPTLAGGAPIQAIAYDVTLPEGDMADALAIIQNAHTELELGVYPRYTDGTIWSHVVLRSADETVLATADTELIQALKALGAELKTVS